MDAEQEFPPVTTLEEVVFQRNEYIKLSQKHANTINQNVLLLKQICFLLGKGVLEFIEKDESLKNAEPPSLDSKLTILNCVKNLNDEHTRLGTVIMDICSLLGIAPAENDTNKNAIRDLTNALIYSQDSGFIDSSSTIIRRVICQLMEVEHKLNSVTGVKSTPNEYMLTDKKPADQDKKIELRIDCRYVNGRLQIGYMRDEQGREMNLSDYGGTVAFRINVTIDEYLVNPKIPEVVGVIG